ncbi:helix-turn-helix domain-containing protein [Neobacillus bataviensis]|uniref:helix-turn-helix domain-containing protein n=1 Tax=Neobacillus bataviensis TaxID=220685 RepID=UPI001CBAE0AA|nr:helix-turn-helix domain-containing protein [Neobacillus bataviensis]
MLNLAQLRSFFIQNLGISCYEIWFYTPVEHRWILTDRQGIRAFPSPTTKKGIQPSSLDNPQLLTLDYPHDYRVTILYTETTTPLEKGNINLLYHLMYPFYTDLLMKRKGIELEKLIEGVQNITVSLDLDELLAKILDNVAAVIPGSEACVFWMYSPALDRLVCKAYRGWKKEIEKVRYKIGESVTGKTFLDGQPRIYYSFREANEAMEGTSDENYKYLKHAFHNHRVKVSVTIPIKFRDEIIGVLSIHQDDRERNLTDWDFQLLQGLAAQIAIAMENARLFTEIKRKNQVLVKRNEVDSTLSQLSVQNRGVETITQELNRMLGLSLIFVDMIESEHFPKQKELPFSMDELTKLLTTRKVPIYVELFDQDEKAFFIYPILVGSVCNGCMIIVINRPLTQLEHIIIDRGGTVLAMELAKKKSLADIYYKKTHEFYNDLLLNDNPDLLTKKAMNLGLDLKSNLFTVIITIANFKDLQILDSIVHRFISRIKQVLLDHKKIVFGNHNKVTILFSPTNPADKRSVMKKLDTILKESELNDHIHLFVGVGSVYQGIESVAKSHNEANKAVSYLISRQKSGMIHFSDIGINRLFINQSSEEIERFLEEIFTPLNSIKGNNNDLEKTLITYIQTNRSSAKTAQKLHIHVNTLYLRLKKIEEQLGMSLEEPENFLKVQLACHLRESFL